MRTILTEEQEMNFGRYAKQLTRKNTVRKISGLVMAKDGAKKRGEDALGRKNAAALKKIILKMIFGKRLGAKRHILIPLAERKDFRFKQFISEGGKGEHVNKLFKRVVAETGRIFRATHGIADEHKNNGISAEAWQDYLHGVGDMASSLNMGAKMYLERNAKAERFGKRETVRRMFEP